MKKNNFKKNIVAKLVLLFIALWALSCASAKQKPAVPSGGGSPAAENTKASSEIPARREFPVNSCIDPCADFYGYACSKVNSSFKLREDRSYHDFAFSDSSERLLEAKKKFLKDLSGESTTPISLHRKDLKNVYNACMNEEASKNEEKFYVDLIKAKVDARKTREELQDFMAKNILSKDDGIIEFDSTSNLENPDTYDAILISPLQRLPERSYYDNPELMKEFESIAAEMFKIIGRDRPEERAKAVINFEKEFSKTYPLPAEFRELFNSKREISRKDLLEKFPHLKLQYLLAKVPKNVHIRNITPDNFEYLNGALNQLPLDVLKDIYLVQILPHYMDDAYPEFFKKRFEFNHKYLGGPPIRPDRQERCTKMVMELFTRELDSELVPVLFPQFPSGRVIKLVKKVRDSIILGLETNTWLSKEGRQKAIKKMQVARLQLVKPMNDREWDFNPPADYSPTTPYSNRRTLQYNLLLKKLKELRHPRDKSRWEMGPLTVNAYYSPPDNKFVLPIGILQYPFFENSLSDEANLGAVGAVVGHELGHGIDDKGARYDEKGRFSQWMTPADIEEFSRRGKRLVTQFNGLGINGELTLGENIGDLVGVTSAYRAAFPAGHGTPEEKKAFFLQYARLWCNVMRPKFREIMIKTNPHSFGEARTNQQMKNQEGFIEAYSCKPGDKMVLPPDEHVQIW